MADWLEDDGDYMREREFKYLERTMKEARSPHLPPPALPFAETDE